MHMIPLIDFSNSRNEKKLDLKKSSAEANDFLNVRPLCVTWGDGVTSVVLVCGRVSFIEYEAKSTSYA